MDAFAAAADAAWSAIKDDSNEKSWLVLSVLPNKTLELSGSGRCGLDRVASHLRPDGVQFAVVRVYAVEPAVKQPKYALITWTGPAAPLKVKVASASLKPFASKYFAGMHTDFELESLEGLTEADITRRLAAARGSHTPARWQFGTGNAEDVEEAEHAAAMAEKARMEAEAKAAAEAAAAKEAEEKRLAVEREKKVKALPTRTRSELKRTSVLLKADTKGYDFSAVADSNIAVSLSDTDAELAWFIMSISEGAPKTFTVCATGNGGLAELAAHLKDDDIQFGAFRVTAVDREGTRMSLRARIVSFAWNGPAINTRTRIRNREAYGAANKFLEAISILELQLDGDRAKLEPEAVIAKIKTVSKAGDYKFGHYSIDDRAEEYFAHLETVKAATEVEKAKDAEQAAAFSARAAAKAEAAAADAAARHAAEEARLEQQRAEEAAEKARRAAAHHIKESDVAARVVADAKQSRGAATQPSEEEDGATSAAGAEPVAPVVATEVAVPSSHTEPTEPTPTHEEEAAASSTETKAVVEEAPSSTETKEVVEEAAASTEAKAAVEDAPAPAQEAVVVTPAAPAAAEVVEESVQEDGPPPAPASVSEEATEEASASVKEEVPVAAATEDDVSSKAAPADNSADVPPPAPVESSSE